MQDGGHPDILRGQSREDGDCEDGGLDSDKAQPKYELEDAASMTREAVSVRGGEEERPRHQGGETEAKDSRGTEVTEAANQGRGGQETERREAEVGEAESQQERETGHLAALQHLATLEQEVEAGQQSDQQTQRGQAGQPRGQPGLGPDHTGERFSPNNNKNK